MRDIRLLSKILRMNQEQLHSYLKSFLKKHYGRNYVISDEEFLYAFGEEDYPVLMVAHMDTVYDSYFRELNKSVKKKELIYHREMGILWSPQGLGADDRAGVFMIMMAILDGYRPHVLFTRDEEIGGYGATAFGKSNLGKELHKEVRYIIQLDRSGSDDSVFYDCDNIKFETYINSFGFYTQRGSFSDISILCPETGVAGVNLSVGYYKEHTLSEFLSLLQMYKNYDIIIKMIKDSIHLKENFDYLEYAYTERGLSFPNGVICDICTIPADKLTKVAQVGYVCDECLVYFN